LAFPLVVGADAAGIVESVGAAARQPTELKVGDRVYFHADLRRSADGALAEYCCCDASVVSKIADNVSFADAAAVPTCAWNAYVAIFDKLRVTPPVAGQGAARTIFIAGGTTGVGMFCVSMAKLMGLRVIATAADERGERHLADSLGVDACLRHSDDRAVQHQKIMALTANVGCDYAIDALGNAATFDGYFFTAAVRFGGQMCTFFDGTPISSVQLLRKQLSLHFVDVNGLYADAACTRPLLQFVGARVMQMMAAPVNAAGAVLPSHLAELVQLSQASAALSAVHEGATFGRIVVSFKNPTFARDAGAGARA
jgi:NADPH:quinone reductase-like Zn-dependent oxidoreductase